jgi:hypothetical protein
MAYATHVGLILTILFAVVGLLLPWTVALGLRLRAMGHEIFVGRMGWQPIVHSTLTFVLAFNLTFFIQELFLVLPKAMVPGLHPTLYHNNHNWTGGAPIAELYQGTGALAILVSGIIFSVIAANKAKPSFLVLWMAFNGLFQSLPQFVVGAIAPSNDVGRAYDYLGLGPAGEALLAVTALAAMPVAGIWLGRQFLSAAWDQGQLGSYCCRFGFLLRTAGLPTLAALPLIILFRVPREAIEVLASPILVPLFGYGWLQFAAFRPGIAKARGVRPVAVLPLLLAVAALLAIFQLVLRPGIAF